MPDYDHHRKAGNQGDIVKHPALIAALASVINSSKGFCRYADTFAAYAWNPLVQGHEWASGIGKVAENPLLMQNEHTADWATRYLAPAPAVGGTYPGSARIAADVAEHVRADLRMSLWDIAPGPIQSLNCEFGGKHDIFQRPARADEPAIQKANFLFIDPPDKSHWPGIRGFLNSAPPGQAILVWLPVSTKTMTPPTEDRVSEDCRNESLALNLRVTKVRWPSGGGTIGCQLVYRLNARATESLRAAVESVVSAADWCDDAGQLGARHYDP